MAIFNPFNNNPLFNYLFDNKNPLNYNPFDSAKKRQKSNNPVNAIVNSLIDNEVRTMVEEPAIGSVVYCDLAFSTVEHSGIYVGNNKIVHLNGDGIVEKVTAKKFLARLDGINTAITIMTSCDGSTPVGSKAVAKRAKKKVGKKLDYKLLEKNCHAFCISCLINDFNYTHSMLLGGGFSLLIETAENELSADDWRAWDY